ncbi:TDT family transporter [Treponema vincentii]|uniref:TDT family transporter n=1 Tax=Treponema vincentii TaxID=69710 RepID=UPI001BAF3A9D|nr:TDT family transporter [Treponema vincentii]QUY17140.1 TDT family transporter [Treponema vincentii]
MAFLKKYPIPIAGLILSLFALGNLLQSYSNRIRLAIGFLAFILYAIYVLKLLFLNTQIKSEFENPVIASVFPTFTMASMLFAVYLKVFFPALGNAVWYAAVLGHCVLIVWFSCKFLPHFAIKKVFPSWYIVYVGIVVASVTAPAVKQLLIGQIAFWFGFLTYLCLIPIVCYRIIKVKEIPEPAQPTLVILSAPGSLLLAGYLNAFPEKTTAMVYLLLVFSLVFYVIAIGCLPKLLRLKFTPGYSAFTFPLVISALAVKLTGAYFKRGGALLTVITKTEEIVAVVIVFWVLVCYSVFLFQPNKNSQ